MAKKMRSFGVSGDTPAYRHKNKHVCNCCGWAPRSVPGVFRRFVVRRFSFLFFLFFNVSSHGIIVTKMLQRALQFYIRPFIELWGTWRLTAERCVYNKYIKDHPLNTKVLLKMYRAKRQTPLEWWVVKKNQSGGGITGGWWPKMSPGGVAGEKNPAKQHFLYFYFFVL